VVPLRIGLGLGAASLAGLSALHANEAMFVGFRPWAPAWRSRWRRSARW
jgi:hypothetical protein